MFKIKKKEIIKLNIMSLINLNIFFIYRISFYI